LFHAKKKDKKEKKLAERQTVIARSNATQQSRKSLNNSGLPGSARNDERAF
jgi:hypothetical protein